MDEIDTIRSTIKEKRLSWTAGDTPQPLTCNAAKMRRLGLVVPEDEKKKIQELIA